MRIFHVALESEWHDALEAGSYRTSTYGRTLLEEGFIHAARSDQVRSVLRRHYAEASENLVLLEIETDLLDVPWREETVGEESFPHIYGPLPVAAVVSCRDVHPPGS